MHESAEILPQAGGHYSLRRNSGCDSDSGGGREAGGRQERRDEGNWAQEWGRVETGGGCVVG